MVKILRSQFTKLYECIKITAIYQCFRRLLNQTSESIEREKQLKEAEQLYLTLRQMVSHQPGADVKVELVKTQRALALRGAKMKVSYIQI